MPDFPAPSFSPSRGRNGSDFNPKYNKAELLSHIKTYVITNQNAELDGGFQLSVSPLTNGHLFSLRLFSTADHSRHLAFFLENDNIVTEYLRYIQRIILSIYVINLLNSMPTKVMAVDDRENQSNVPQ